MTDPLQSMGKTYISNCFYFNERKEQTPLEAVVNALEKWTFITKLHAGQFQRNARFRNPGQIRWPALDRL